MIKLRKFNGRRLLGMVAVSCTGLAAWAMIQEGEELLRSPVVWLVAAILCVLWCIYGVLLEILEAQHVTGELTGEMLGLMNSFDSLSVRRPVSHRRNGDLN